MGSLSDGTGRAARMMSGGSGLKSRAWPGVTSSLSTMSLLTRWLQFHRHHPQHCTCHLLNLASVDG
eukprot:scaffold67601_cov24-Prasinocladus_malaysianus.AAC.1